MQEQIDVLNARIEELEQERNDLEDEVEKLKSAISDAQCYLNKVN